MRAFPLFATDGILILFLLRNDVIGNLSTLDEMAQNMQTMIPIQVLADIDNSRNPMQLTRERLERAATENQFMNGKIAAIEVSIYAITCFPGNFLLL